MTIKIAAVAKFHDYVSVPDTVEFAVNFHLRKEGEINLKCFYITDSKVRCSFLSFFQVENRCLTLKDGYGNLGCDFVILFL